MPHARLVERLRAFGRLALLVLAVALPFERIEPLARLGPLQLSSVEVFLYLALAAWGLAAAAGIATSFAAGERDLLARVRRAPAAYWAVAAFALATFVSAAVATASRGPALKFALRSLGGMLLFAAAADLLRAPAAAARMAKALVAGAVVAALMAVAEARTTSASLWLRPFHPQTFQALGQLRAGGPFQYPNIAAMYLEAVAPLAVALAVSAYAARRSAARLCAWALALFAILDGVLATASRAGLVGALCAVAALGLGWALARPTRAPALAALAAALAVTALASGSALAGRFRFWNDGAWYRATIAQAGGPEGRLPPRLVAGSVAAETLEVRNDGALPWLRVRPSPVALSYHWLDAATGKAVVFDGARTFFADDIMTGGAAQVRAKVRAPARAGRYVLWWDLVHEHTSWFSERGNPGLREAVLVTGADAAPTAVGYPRRPIIAAPIAGAADGMPRGTLWRAAVAAFRAHPLLGIGPDNFRHLSGQYLGRIDIDERMHANSLYFETLADLGAVGSLAFAALVVAFAGAAGRAVKAPATRLLTLGTG
ncbi:MAG TPA: O-antigen ligase family protein, partial [Polyangia bacterium]